MLKLGGSSDCAPLVRRIDVAPKEKKGKNSLGRVGGKKALEAQSKKNTPAKTWGGRVGKCTISPIAFFIAKRMQRATFQEWGG